MTEERVREIVREEIARLCVTVSVSQSATSPRDFATWNRPEADVPQGAAPLPPIQKDEP